MIEAHNRLSAKIVERSRAAYQGGRVVRDFPRAKADVTGGSSGMIVAFSATLAIVAIVKLFL